MRVVYADTLFLLNLTVDYLLLLLTARLTGRYVRRRYLLLGAAVGAVFALLLYFPPLPTLLSLALRVLCGGLTLLCAFGGQPYRHWPRLGGTFLLLTCLLAGVVFALGQTGRVSQQNGSIYYDISSGVMLIGFTVIFCLSGLVLGKGRASAGRAWRAITLEQNGAVVDFRALCDSGNLLRDPINGKSVIVAEPAALAPLFHLTEPELRALLRTDDRETMLALLRERATTPVWLLPVQTVGAGGLLPVFCPRRLLIEGKEQAGYLIGMTAERLALGGDCSALMGV